MVSNKYNFIGLIAGGALVMFIIYTPPFHSVFGGSHKLLPLYWLIPIAFGFLILAWACIRVLLARRSIEQARVKDIHGLKMCKCLPTLLFVSIIMLIISLSSPYDAYRQFARAALRDTKREGQPEMRLFAIMPMIIVNVHL